MTLLVTLPPFLFAGAIGFSHAFEADHLIAVSSIVSRRQQVWHAVRDGIFWGLGHTSTILLIGLIMIGGKVQIAEGYFTYFEGGVGLMLVCLGAWRLYRAWRQPETHVHTHGHTSHQPGMAYGVGLIHGLAGSGALILLVMTQVSGSLNMMGYLLTFGIGSVLGMMLAAGVFTLPITRQWVGKQFLQRAFLLISSLLCLVYGGWLMWESWG